MPELTRAEEELGQKWDRCLMDTLIKTGSGIGLGIVFSVVLFKRRPFPVIFGSGMGLGMAYSNCQHDLQAPFTGTLTKITEPSLVDQILKGKN